MRAPTPTRRRRVAGFTLMEVMAAIAITAMMGGVIAASFATLFHAKETIESEAERYRMLRTAMDRITREISCAYVSDRYDPKRYRDQNDRPSNFIGEKDRLLFTSFGHQRMALDAKESDEMVVEYKVKAAPDPDAKGRRDLVRRENTEIGEHMERGGQEDSVFENVKSIEFSYWDSDRREWLETWDTRRLEKKSILPTRVKITLIVKDENNKEVKYQTQTRIVLNAEFARY